MSERVKINREYWRTGVQESLERMTMHCAKQFDCAIAVVSILDAENQTFVAKFGTELEGSPREISFCRRVVDGGEPMIVGDARSDDRFRDNPLVTGVPFIRSYAGFPITLSNGEIVGTLCLIDGRPHKFETAILEWLQRYAQGVSDLIRLHESCLESAALAATIQDQIGQVNMANRVFRQAEQVARIGSWELEVGSRQLYWSEGVYRIHELEPGTPISIEQAYSYVLPGDRQLVQKAINRAIAQGEPLDFEISLETAQGSICPVQCIGEYVAATGEHPARLIGVVRDISTHYEAQSALEYAATHDSLTNLLNRRSIDQCLQKSLAAQDADGEGVILLIIDLDGFKEVNDTYGHLAGDFVLEEVANRIRAAELQGSILARWGGDEFVILLPEGTSIEAAVEYGEKVLEHIRHETAIGGQSIAITGTCGLARSESGVSSRELIRRADTALYNGKKRNPGTVIIYEDAMEKANRHRQLAIREVTSAIRDDRLFAGYQPIIDLRNGDYVGFEALLRLNSDQGEQLTAGQVLPALMDPMVSRQVSCRMMEIVASEVRQLFAAYPSAQFVSLNATEGDLLWPQFTRTFLSAFRRENVDLRMIVLEVTETMLLVNDPDAVREVLSELSSVGVQIALDDFGTGFSSLSHLRDFPINKVKIDGSFVQSMADKHGSRLIVQAIIGMANSLDIEVVAEGIETEDQRELLLRMGCPTGQGFLFSPAEKLGDLCPWTCSDRIYKIA